jgi:hypothetical protein
MPPPLAAALSAQLTFALVLALPSLFRRREPKATRASTYQELFDVLANIYEGAAQLKPLWMEHWQARAGDVLPPKFDFGNPIAEQAARDMRFAAGLLQRNRWRSVVAPLFDDIDPRDWSTFVGRVAPTAAALLRIRDARGALLLPDEIDWLDDAIEQFDEVLRGIRRAETDEQPLVRQVAEGTYQYVYQAIRLSDRLIERLRFEAAQRKG